MYEDWLARKIFFIMWFELRKYELNHLTKLNIDIISLSSLLKISYFYRLQVNTYTGVNSGVNTVLTPVLVWKKIEFISGVELTLNTEARVELTLTLTLTPEMNSLIVDTYIYRAWHCCFKRNGISAKFSVSSNVCNVSHTCHIATVYTSFESLCSKDSNDI